MESSKKATFFHRGIRYFLPAGLLAACFLGLGGAAVFYSGTDAASLCILGGLMLSSILLYLWNTPDRHTLDVLIFLLVPALTFLMAESFAHIPWNGDMNPGIFLLNLLFYYLLAFLLFFITGRSKISLCIMVLFFCFAGVANYYVTLFRSTPIVPWDITSIKTAMSVADNFTFTVDYALAIKMGLALLLLVLASKAGLRVKKIPLRLLSAIACTAGIAAFTYFLHHADVNSIMNFNVTLFYPKYMCKENGLAANFIYNCQYLTSKAPEGYNKEEAENTLEEFQQQETADTDTPPNIIVIMNETFSDPNVLGDFATNQDYMPFLHSLQEGQPDTITGNLHVSIVGGNTANTEFEFLTGNSLAFLPSGSVAYQQYVHSGLTNMAEILNEKGYTTYGLHPFYANGWNRKNVYSYLGFQNALFLDDFEDAPLLRKYVSDQGCMEKIISLYEKKGDQPLFAFNVTMQNHSGYGDVYDNFDPDIEVEVSGKSNKYLDNYLSLMKHSDQAFKELISYFSETPDKTIVVMFGDHQPNDYVVEPIYQQNGKDINNLTPEDQQKRYIVPYVIWANYDIPELELGDISTNYLSSVVMELAGLGKSPYQNFLSDMRKEIPVLSAIHYVDSKGVSHDWKEGEEPKSIQEYKQLQYYQLFDRK